MNRRFASAPFHELLGEIAARTPTPGGGTAAALVGALGGALACMAVRFSIQRKDSTPEQDAVLGAVEKGLIDVGERLKQLADEDAAAFEGVRAARKLPQASVEESAARTAALRRATLQSAGVPLMTTRLCRDAVELLDGTTGVLNRNLATDAASGAMCLRAGARAAALNVRVNLVGDATTEAQAMRAEVTRLLARCDELERRIVGWADGILG